MAVEVEPYHQYHIMFCFCVTDGHRGIVRQNDVWYGSVYGTKVWKKCYPLTFTDTCWMLMEAKQWMWAQWGGWNEERLNQLIHTDWLMIMLKKIVIWEFSHSSTVVVLFVSVVVSMEINRGHQIQGDLHTLGRGKYGTEFNRADFDFDTRLCMWLYSQIILPFLCFFLLHIIEIFHAPGLHGSLHGRASGFLGPWSTMATKYCLIITEIIETRLGPRTDTGCFLKGLENEGRNGEGKHKVLVAYTRKEEFSIALKSLVLLPFVLSSFHSSCIVSWFL